MKKILSIVGTVMFLIAGQVCASQVSGVALQYQEGYTVARIDIDGTVRFSHQTEQAKDGKPFRIIVDVLSAIHYLPVKNFLSLPECPVQRIRTSQYAVKPEKIVRLVFDMEEETTYRINSDDKSITLLFPDRQHRKFTNWLSSSYAVALERDDKPAKDKSGQPRATAPTTDATRSKKSVAEINEAIDNDRMLSLAGEPPVKATAPHATQTEPEVVVDKKPVASAKKPETGNSKASPKVQLPKAVTGNVSYGPQFDSHLLEPTVPKPTVDVSPSAKTQPAEPATTAKSQPSAMKSSVASAKDKPMPSKKLVSGKQDASTKVDVNKKAVAGEGKQLAVSQPTVAKKSESKPEPPKVSAQIGKPGSVSGGELAVSKEPAQTKASSPLAKKSSTGKTKAKTGKPVLASSSSSQQPAEKKTPEKEAAKSSPKATKQGKVTDKQDSTVILKEKESKGTKKPTSRFRRSPTRPTKIKGTLVAEFPKRLVIKYKTRSHRDPFETLINDTKTYNSPIEKRIPNVEGLKMVGVLESADGVNSALFEDKEGYGYILSEGDKVQKGYVLRIESDRVYFQIFEYGWSRTFALNIDQD